LVTLRFLLTASRLASQRNSRSYSRHGGLR
jgi:hypothetical protein